jgi:hypothetical protein
MIAAKTIHPIHAVCWIDGDDWFGAVELTAPVDLVSDMATPSWRDVPARLLRKDLQFARTSDGLVAS